jgi:hypothetical protein
MTALSGKFLNFAPPPEVSREISAKFFHWHAIFLGRNKELFKRNTGSGQVISVTVYHNKTLPFDNFV